MLDTHGDASQQELARLMGVAPSLVVALADHLERLRAIRRVRDPVDRRRQNLVITKSGRGLLRSCARVSQELEEEVTTGLSADQRGALHRLLGLLAAAQGLPT